MSTNEPIRITNVTITPVAFADPPLLNSVGVHEPFALRAIIEVATDAGLPGLGETYADEKHLAALHAAAKAIEGADVYHTEEIYRRVQAIAAPETTIASGLIGHSAATDRVFSPFEVACLDIQGKAAGRPVADLLGGAVRDEVPFSAYLFYKWAAHPGRGARRLGRGARPGRHRRPGQADDRRLRVHRDQAQGRRLPARRRRSRRSSALRDAFPGHPLRLDPNAAWTPPRRSRSPASLTACSSTWRTRRRASTAWPRWRGRHRCRWPPTCAWWPSPTWPPAVRQNAVQVILSDHHYWGGLRRSQLLAGICETFGIGLSMHSNSHLGISLAAMVHLAAAVPNLTYACDTHWPWKTEDVVAGHAVHLPRRRAQRPARPGLGVELDRDALARLHEQYLACGLRNRDDTGYMQRFVPGYERKQPRW